MKFFQGIPPGTPPGTSETDRHDITEILRKIV
jgi:hypothetical protein